MKTVKPVKGLVAFIVALMLLSVNMPFAAMAAVDDVFAQGNLIN